ncbi:hypothetical protein ILUMI_25484 [Ignelater luminosus]|uniref:Uncharacterized protein n=1 Tax=Ignelater luminosus TaxID=2038154 RepID=A0A8K0G009_IGNLU|nr:hypothetical protein ILUMI_25484 [Ignelater luminosus]
MNVATNFRNLTTRTYLKEHEVEAHTLNVHLKQRLSSYKDSKSSVWFFSRLKTLNSEELKQSCKDFVEIYYEDVSEKQLEMECLHLTEYLKIVQFSENEENNSLSGVYHLLKENKIEDTFPNWGTLLFQIEKDKNELRSTMLDERLTSFSLMSIECDVLKDIVFEEVIDNFACLKSRRVPLSLT